MLIDNTTVLILVGGEGKRIRHLYPTLPKPLIPVAGKPFLHWILKEIRTINIKNVIFAAGFLGDRIQKWVENNEFDEINQKVIIEDQKLGTAGSIFNALEYCKENIIILNGDSLLVGGIKKIYRKYRLFDLDYILVSHYSKNSKNLGFLEIDKNLNLKAFKEKTSDLGYVNSGIYYFNKNKLIKYSNKIMSLEYELFPKLLNNDEKIKVIKVSNPEFLDIGTECSLQKSDEFVKRNFLNV